MEKPPDDTTSDGVMIIDDDDCYVTDWHEPSLQRLVVVGWTGTAAESVSESIRSTQLYYPAPRDTIHREAKCRYTYPGRIHMIYPKYNDGRKTDYPVLGIVVNPIKEDPKKTDCMMDMTYNINFINSVSKELADIATSRNIKERFGLHIIDMT